MYYSHSVLPLLVQCATIIIKDHTVTTTWMTENLVHDFSVAQFYHICEVKCFLTITL